MRRDDLSHDTTVPPQGAPTDTAIPPIGSPFGAPQRRTQESVPDSRDLRDPATDDLGPDVDRREDHHDSVDVEPEPGREPELLVEPEPVTGQQDEPVRERVDEPVPAAAGEEDAGAVLFGTGDVERFRGQWRELQADFVDDPKEAVQGADRLVGEVMDALTSVVAEHKRTLEDGWHNGAGETEDLRVALRRYRSFFDQLLKT